MLFVVCLEFDFLTAVIESFDSFVIYLIVVYFVVFILLFFHFISILDVLASDSDSNSIGL